jgi:murein DD-endopeptidase MepM/ murein hydrolase activator NlpD
MKKIIIILISIPFLLYSPLSYVFAKTVEELRAEINRYEQEIERLKQEQKKLSQNIAVTQEQAKTLQNEISRINNQIKYINNQIYLTNIEINKTKAEITDLNDEIFTTQSKIELQKNAIGELLLEIQKQDRESLIIAIFKNANISDFLNRFQNTLDVSKNLVNLLGELKTTKNIYEKNLLNLENKKLQLEFLSNQQISQKSLLNQTQKDKNLLLKITKGREAEYQKLLLETEELERQVNLQIFKLEEELRKKIDPNSLPLARRGILEWPTQGAITQNYGCIHTAFARRHYPDCDNGRGGFHNGLDIAANYGAPIKAAENGKVIATGNAPYAYGVWVAVEHDNGLVTAYTHLSVRNVSVGQQVKRGDVIGNMGSTGLSTGSHLHFMVYAPKTFTTKPSSISGLIPIGATLNPADYL